jgi:hypothetical protein
MVALDAFRNFASRIIPKDPIQEPRSRISHTGLNSIFASNKSKSSGFPPYFPISQPGRIQFNKFNQSNPFVGGAKRYYYVDRYKVQHFRPRGPQRWFQNPEIRAGCGSGGFWGFDHCVLREFRDCPIYQANPFRAFVKKHGEEARRNAI